ncbi:Protein of unknown function [Flavobacterium resistens]|uniref:DUF3164 family protein n=1 Tax=Flavobacterium resistens TaxID=443612 RepID=A0A521B6R8_9FLAO|nr:DUF3164 family protein [Flavobacterium resistens]MRX70293.1 DUF3164 family protein [Flavobacterium resistens]SMO42360.1 Protein of unknown function [Flavobacterium resistens]
MNSNTIESNINLSSFTPAQLKAALAEKAAKTAEDRTAYKELVEQTVPKVLFELAIASETLSKAKTEAFKYFENVLQIKANLYGIKEKQMSHTFSSEEGEITLGFRINDGWDDTVNTGIAKVENYISSLAKDEASGSLVKMVFNLLKKDSKGNLKGSRVLELQKLTKEFNNDEFTDGVDIISKAYKPQKSVYFCEASTIKDDGSKVSIPLSLSSVDFVSGYQFDFHNEPVKS